MKIVKLAIYSLIFISFIYLIFNLNSSINNLSLVLVNFFKSLFPYLFIFLIINQLLIKTNLISLIGYFLQFFLYPIFKINAKTIVLLLLSLINGFPSSVLYSSIMVKENKIDKKSTHTIASIFFLPSFTFIFYLIKNNLSFPYFLIFILSLYLPCFILLLINRNKSQDKYINFKQIKTDLINSFNSFNYINDLKNIFLNSVLTLINILGMISFYSILTLIIPINLIKGLFEFSMPSLNILIGNNTEMIKSLLLLIILVFSSFSSISQALVYLQDISLSTSLFIKKRIELLSLSLFIFSILLYLYFL